MAVVATLSITARQEPTKSIYDPEIAPTIPVEPPAALMFEYTELINPVAEPAEIPVTSADWYDIPQNELPERLQGLYIPSAYEVKITAQMTYGESRGIKSITEQAGDIWCALNRVDATGYGMGKSLEHVILFPDQFHGYNPNNPMIDDCGRDLEALTIDVITRWINEKLGYENTGRVLPEDYLWFESDGHGHNVFRNAYHSKDADKWGWTLSSPYES